MAVPKEPQKKPTTPERPIDRRGSRERRIDVTRIEYEELCFQVERNTEAMKRLAMADEIQLQRTAELQNEIDLLKRQLSKWS